MNKDQRILQLEEAVDMALTYLEAIMGSDFDESETVKHIEALLKGD